MFQTIKRVTFLFVFFVLLTGLAYPLLMTAVAQAAFPFQANGSLLTRQDGSITGSMLIGQTFDDPKYFWGRLSATADKPFNAISSGGSNYSILNDALKKQVQARINTLKAIDPENPLPIPVDLVTASASGLDPHISPAAAHYQAARVALARGLTDEQVQSFIAQYTEIPFFAILGEPRVNVFLLNLALDSVQ